MTNELIKHNFFQYYPTKTACTIILKPLLKKCHLEQFQMEFSDTAGLSHAAVAGKLFIILCILMTKKLWSRSVNYVYTTI